MRYSHLKLLVVVAILITTFGFYRKLRSNNVKLKSDSIFEDDKLEYKNSILDKMPVDMVQRSSKHPSSDLYQQALATNFEQYMYNIDRFGIHTTNSVIFLVQVHDRTAYFQELINSLQSVRGIEKVTLVVSMDRFSSEIDEILSAITFCRYMKIFFPFSKQIFPNSFPGEDPNDCPRDISKADALSRKCNNAEFPDMFGHYREIKYVQVKHHWLWKLHMTFSGIRVFNNQESPVLLLEDDYYVLPDILHNVELAISLKNTKCSKCTTITLGNYEPNQDSSLSNQVNIEAWTSSKSNMGMVVTKDFYSKIAKCTDDICEYDDYNWDWSIQASSLNCMPGKLFTIIFKYSRIIHLGSCGGLHSSSNCNIKDELENAQKKINIELLFPEDLHVAADNPAPAAIPRPNGGWGDLRDQTLCKGYETLCKSGLKT